MKKYILGFTVASVLLGYMAVFTKTETECLICKKSMEFFGFSENYIKYKYQVHAICEKCATTLIDGNKKEL